MPKPHREDFLHFLWQYQYFNQQHLQTTEGESVQILKRGIHNHDAGPDFLEAAVSINDVTWHGQVEIHVKSSDWYLHNHQVDRAYDNVVLHVVLEHDRTVYRTDGTIIPTLELQSLYEEALHNNYQTLINTLEAVPCASRLKDVKRVNKVMLLDKMTMERLEQKAHGIREMYLANGKDWRETTYQLLSKNLGFKKNTDPMLMLSEKLPLKVLQKHRNNLFQQEALMFGAGGFFQQSARDEYFIDLQKEYLFLQKKYGLGEVDVVQWKFFRTRPANFPTVRIAQLAAVIYHNADFFSSFIEAEKLDEIRKVFHVEPSDYWKGHYNFGKEGQTTTLGSSSIDNIVINTIAPLLVFYGEEKGGQVYIERAVSLLEQIKSEDNKITRLMNKAGFPMNNGCDTQGGIQLFNEYCSKKRCLECNIGVLLMKEAAC